MIENAIAKVHGDTVSQQSEATDTPLLQTEVNLPLCSRAWLGASPEVPRHQPRFHHT